MNRFVTAMSLVAGVSMLGFGVWALLAPASFADLIDYAPYNEHLIHDAGAFQVGIGATVLLALRWRDALGVALAGFVVAGGLHALNHVLDLHLGGHDIDPWALGALTLTAAAGLVARLATLKKETE